MRRRLLGSRIAPAVIGFALTLPGATQLVIPTAGTPPGPRTGMIVGQVLDAITGAPVPEAIVRLSMPLYAMSPTSPNARVMADREGRYFFADLPAGDFYLEATKEGYQRGIHGQRTASDDRGQLLGLGQNERRTDVQLRMWKYGVISGSVVDETGEPVVGVAVRALVKSVVAGRPQFGTQSYLVPSVLTDDRGMFRFSQVTPSTYVVVVPYTQMYVPVSLMTSMEATALRNELFWAGVYETSPLGQPRTQQVGDTAVMTLSSVQIPPSLPATGRLDVYRTTYYPAATTVSTASEIAVAAGEERAGLTITLRPVPGVRVSGRLVAPDGSAPPPMSIRLVGESAADIAMENRPSSSAEVGFDTVTGMSDASGRFTLLGVPAGEYVVKQANSFLMRVVRAGLPAYWVSQRLSVGSRDVTDLTIALRPALRVEGRFEFRGVNGPQAPPATFSGAIVFETPSGEPGQFAAETNRETHTFSTVAAGGRYIARPYDSGGWFVHSVRAGDADITDRAFDLQTDTSIVVTYTDRASKLTGTVSDTRGRASATAMVLVFPVDRQRWSGHGRSPRFVASTPASRDGRYTFAHLPPGDYYVVAIDGAESDGWRDAAVLDVLSRRATMLTIAAGAAGSTIDLTVVARR